MYSSAAQLVLQTFPKQKWIFFPVSHVGLVAGLVCDPALSCALREASARLCNWSNIHKAPGAPAPGLFHEPIWALRIIFFFFFFMSAFWCWPGLFHSMSHFPRAHQVLSYPSTFWQGGKWWGNVSCSSKGRKPHTCADRHTVPMHQKLIHPKKSTPVAKTFRKTNEDLNCMEQCDQLAFFCLVDLFQFCICNYLNQCSSQQT